MGDREQFAAGDGESDGAEGIVGGVDEGHGREVAGGVIELCFGAVGGLDYGHDGPIVGGVIPGEGDAATAGVPRSGTGIEVDAGLFDSVDEVGGYVVVGIGGRSVVVDVLLEDVFRAGAVVVDDFVAVLARREGAEFLGIGESVVADLGGARLEAVQLAVVAVVAEGEFHGVEDLRCFAGEGEDDAIVVSVA